MMTDHDLLEFVERALMSFAGGRPVGDGPELLLRGPSRPNQRLATLDSHGRISPNGTCRLLRADDRWLAIQLARPTDVAAVPGVVEGVTGEPWSSLEHFASGRSAADVVARCRLLDIPAAVVGEIAGSSEGIVTHRVAPIQRANSARSGVVIDLSSLWAGPLCARLVAAAAGLPVVDVESDGRLDPLRLADDDFARRLHRSRSLRTFDHRNLTGADLIEAHLADAAVVVTSGRRRALGSLRLDPFQWAAATGGLWVHVSGYGLSGPLADAVAFGDDAAAAGGLVGDPDDPHFIFDAVADPLTGLFAAKAACDLLGSAGGAVLDVSLAGVAAAVATGRVPE
jgi:CoA transferase family III